MLPLVDIIRNSLCVHMFLVCFWSRILIDLISMPIFSPFYRFLLPYERHSKGLEEKQIKRSESESGSEKVFINLQ